MKYNIKKDKYGATRYYVNNVLHREDGPAVYWFNKTQEWYKDGLRHREDGPAIEYADGTKCWYKNGNVHRKDGPAIEYHNGEKRWYLNNKCYGHHNDFTVESWKFFVKTLIFS